MSEAPRALKTSVLLTVAGITFSVAVLIVTLSVATGFEAAYKKSILDFNAHVVVLREDGEIANYRELQVRLGSFAGVKSVMPFVYRESMAVKAGKVKGVVLKGIDYSNLDDVSGMLLKNFDLSRSAMRGTYAGAALARFLDIQNGDRITLLVGENRFAKISVEGTFESGLYDYDSQFVMMPVEELRALFSASDEVSGFELRLFDPDDAAAVAEQISEELNYPFSVTTWAELNKPIFDAVKLEKVMFAIVIGMLVLVGLFNIIGTLVLKIIYKSGDIAILSAIGMKTIFVRGLFTFHGLMLGIAGTLSGVVLGFLAVFAIGRFRLITIEPEIYFLSSLPAKVDFTAVTIVVIASVGVSFLVSFIAAGRISSLNLIEGLKESN